MSASRFLGIQRTDQRHVSRGDDYWLNAWTGGGGHVVSLNTKPPRSRQGEGDKVESLKGNFRFHITWVLLLSFGASFLSAMITLSLQSQTANLKGVKKYVGLSRRF